MKFVMVKKYHESYKDLYKYLEIIINMIERQGFTDNVYEMLKSLKKEVENTYFSLSDIYEEEKYLQHIEAQTELLEEMNVGRMCSYEKYCR